MDFHGIKWLLKLFKFQSIRKGTNGPWNRNVSVAHMDCTQNDNQKQWHKHDTKWCINDREYFAFWCYSKKEFASRKFVHLSDSHSLYSLSVCLRVLISGSLLFLFELWNDKHFTIDTISMIICTFMIHIVQNDFQIAIHLMCVNVSIKLCQIVFQIKIVWNILKLKFNACSNHQQLI